MDWLEDDDNDVSESVIGGVRCEYRTLGDCNTDHIEEFCLDVDDADVDATSVKIPVAEVQRVSHSVCSTTDNSPQDDESIIDGEP